MLAPETFVAMCKGRFLAEDGHCKTFDAAADGYARGEGAGVLVLKPLADATRDHDRIYAVIKGTGVNQDGRTSAITVPNPDAQMDLIRRVTADSRCTSRTDRLCRSPRHRHRDRRPAGDGRASVQRWAGSRAAAPTWSSARSRTRSVIWKRQPV